MRPALNKKTTSDGQKEKRLTLKRTSLKCAARFDRNEASFFNKVFRQLCVGAY